MCIGTWGAGGGAWGLPRKAVAERPAPHQRRPPPYCLHVAYSLLGPCAVAILTLTLAGATWTVAMLTIDYSWGRADCGYIQYRPQLGYMLTVAILSTEQAVQSKKLPAGTCRATNPELKTRGGATAQQHWDDWCATQCITYCITHCVTRRSSTGSTGASPHAPEAWAYVPEAATLRIREHGPT